MLCAGLFKEQLHSSFVNFLGFAFLPLRVLIYFGTLRHKLICLPCPSLDAVLHLANFLICSVASINSN